MKTLVWFELAASDDRKSLRQSENIKFKLISSFFRLSLFFLAAAHHVHREHDRRWEKIITCEYTLKWPKKKDRVKVIKLCSNWRNTSDSPTKNKWICLDGGLTGLKNRIWLWHFFSLFRFFHVYLKYPEIEDSTCTNTRESRNESEICKVNTQLIYMMTLKK